MHDDLNWDHFDDLIESYASAFVYEGRRHELELQITSVSSGIAASRLQMDDFTYFLDTGFGGKVALQRKIAWASQHIFQMRAWAVGPALFEKQQHVYFSPLLKQLEALQVAIKPINVNGFRRKAHKRAQYWSQASIDALLVDPVRNHAVLVKGISWSQAKRMNPKVSAGIPGGGLFDPSDRVFQGVVSTSQAIRPLLHAKQLLEESTSLKVDAYYLLIDDPGFSWNYQVHDVGHLTLAGLAKHPQVHLDDAPCVGTFRDKARELQQDSDAFAKLPSWPSTDLLSLVPVDRPCRAMMQLQELFSIQELTPSTLQVVPASTIANQVEDRFRIFYPQNRQRHDIETCLRTGGFVRRLRDRDNEYGITPKGFARCMLMRQKFQPREGFTPSRVIIEIQRQAELWFRARGRSKL